MRRPSPFGSNSCWQDLIITAYLLPGFQHRCNTLKKKELMYILSTDPPLGSRYLQDEESSDSTKSQTSEARARQLSSGTSERSDWAAGWTSGRWSEAGAEGCTCAVGSWVSWCSSAANSSNARRLRRSRARRTSGQSGNGARCAIDDYGRSSELHLGHCDGRHELGSNAAGWDSQARRHSRAVSRRVSGGGGIRERSHRLGRLSGRRRGSDDALAAGAVGRLVVRHRGRRCYGNFGALRHRCRLAAGCRGDRCCVSGRGWGGNRGRNSV